MSREGLFPLEALIRAMAPVQVVMDAFSLACRNSTGSPTGIGSPANQALLARLLHRIEATICTHHSISSHDPPEEEDNPQVVVVSCAPSRRYIHRLVHRYVALLEQQPNNSNLQNHYSLEDDDLMEWVYRGSMEGRHHLDDPNPTDSGYVTFRLPTRPTTSTTTSTTILHPPSRIRMDDNPNEATTSGHSHNPNAVLDDGMDTEEKEEWLAIRVFPHHNQVGLQKVWEAGACLAEFLHQYPDHVRNKKVVEWGAGVGLTGFIVDRIGAERVHLTDGTSALVLDNLTHNVSLYQDQRINSTSRQTNNPHTNDSPPALITTVSVEIIHSQSSERKFSVSVFVFLLAAVYIMTNFSLNNIVYNIMCKSISPWCLIQYHERMKHCARRVILNGVTMQRNNKSSRRRHHRLGVVAVVVRWWNV
uniref:Calmodulin-lysine N-methyltransferase n=1 Tax=Attheya septentrionalis TaxID=420275 RepID=A0A7S2XPE0_9STRA|mmetsp:Transcript_26627/g.48328  ORF Transcript_26627/g.48328 Transcript_26627/m.48328 type:complete len:418 (+) Transcript_26627:196-1449(+)